MDQKEYLKHMMLRTNVPTGNEKNQYMDCN